ARRALARGDPTGFGPAEPASWRKRETVRLPRASALVQRTSTDARDEEREAWTIPQFSNGSRSSGREYCTERSEGPKGTDSLVARSDRTMTCLSSWSRPLRLV